MLLKCKIKINSVIFLTEAFNYVSFEDFKLHVSKHLSHDEIPVRTISTAKKNRRSLIQERKIKTASPNH